MPNHQQGWAVENRPAFHSLKTKHRKKIPRTILSLAFSQGSPSPPPPSAKESPNNAAADLVLGQPNFTTNTFPTPLPSAYSLHDPRGVAIDSNTGKVFIADSANNRILRYSGTAALANGAAAELVFGDPSFQGSSPGISPR